MKNQYCIYFHKCTIFLTIVQHCIFGRNLKQKHPKTCSFLVKFALKRPKFRSLITSLIMYPNLLNVFYNYIILKINKFMMIKLFNFVIIPYFSFDYKSFKFNVFFINYYDYLCYHNINLFILKIKFLIIWFDFKIFMMPFYNIY